MQVIKLFEKIGLDKNVYYMINRRYGSEMNGATKKMMTHKMTINLNVLSVLMKDMIVSKLNDILIVTMDICSIGLIDPHV